MTPEVKVKWIIALRSGEYTQGKKALRVGSTYCCLGVLCDLYQKETGNGKWMNDGSDTLFEVTDSDYSWADLPTTVEEWAGLSGDVQGALSELNDDGIGFESIATIIETITNCPPNRTMW